MNQWAMILAVLVILIGIMAIGFRRNRWIEFGSPAGNLCASMLLFGLSYYAFVESQSTGWGVGYATAAVVALGLSVRSSLRTLGGGPPETNENET